ncbi:MAG: 30S ribosomal protein S4e [Candidatus Nezhaarchaeales archaeon]
MGRMGGTLRLKRYGAPRFWRLHVKEYKWAVHPTPGPHPLYGCIPLIVLLRDVLGMVETAREGKIVISSGKVKVDGKPRRDYRYPVGLMDTVEIRDVGKAYRILPHPRYGLYPHEVTVDEASFKLCRIEDKTTTRGGHLQLNLHDGSNYLVKVSNPQNPTEDLYQTYDVLKLTLPDRAIADHVKLEKGVFAIIIGGKNVGLAGKILEISGGPAKKAMLVTLEGKEGDHFTTPYEYVFPVGREAPLISLPGWAMRG